LGSSPSAHPPPLASIVVTVKNEGLRIRELLESLLQQAPPVEIVVVDAHSRDRTPEISREFAERYPNLVHFYERSGSRGIGRNEGVARARGELIAFIDGDCVADSRWLAEIRAALQLSEVAAGRTVSLGRKGYAELERIELYTRGSDVTFPSCNLAYRRALFEKLGGFDPRFITAEDIDLNLRAVEAGVRIQYSPQAIVYHRMRPTLLHFLYQAFWNGYGRKQLTEKHGSLWGRYQVRRLISRQMSVLAWARIAAATSGYFTRVVTGQNRRVIAAAGITSSGEAAPDRSDDVPTARAH
jgi:glycosyltransferase involved in cell wall biosynthesis